MLGIKLAALYGFYPHRLGFCGPKKNSEKEALFNYLSGKKIPEQKIRKILESFRGAFSYYKLIAESNRIKDPLNEKVVKAYWVGNQLLEKVPVDSLRKMITKKFNKSILLSKEVVKRRTNEIPPTSKAHHSFHVFVVGFVAGRTAIEGQLLDLCRIGWGRVLKYKEEGDKKGLIIEYPPIQKRNGEYFLENPISKFVFWDKNFIPKIKIGDWVSTHWNHVIQTLNKEDLTNLQKYTQNTINSLNKLERCAKAN